MRQNELSGAKSLFINLDMTSGSDNISPVIDLDRCSINAIGNVVNNIDSASDVNETFFASTEPEGDNNALFILLNKLHLKILPLH